MKIDATDMHFKTLNDIIRNAEDADIYVENCNGQRYIGSGLSDKKITIKGTPGNALGAYLNGAKIEVEANGQDAIGDTMNEGEIVIHGAAGDATGYGMRGGKIFVRDNAGYRAGIHMKAYKDKLPVIVIGGSAGSFLGEYQAGGVIIVLGIGCTGDYPVGYFCATGMHGGKIILRSEKLPRLPVQVIAREATSEDMEDVRGYVDEFCEKFEFDKKDIYSGKFFVLTPNSSNPYKQLYTYE